MKKRLLIFVGAPVVLAAVLFAVATPRPQYYYCCDNGRIWVYSEPTRFARYGYGSNGARLGKVEKDGLWGIWNGLRGGVQLTFSIPGSADPLTWRPPREAVLERLTEVEGMPGYQRETYVTNFVSVKERYEDKTAAQPSGAAKGSQPFRSK